MRRFIMAVSLLILPACGGELAPEEAQVPETAQSEGAVATCSNTRECYCAKFKTESTCATATTYPCYWNAIQNTCEPIYF